MAKIYKTTDRITIKIDDITLKIAPLSLSQKADVTSLMMQGQKDADYMKLNQAILKAVSYCVKSVEGLKDSNDEDYKLKLDENGFVSEESLNDLSNCAVSEKILKVSSQLINGVPSDFKIEGVEVKTDEKK